MKNISKIIFVIVATLVGAGFASGKEIYSFFFIYGMQGFVGIFISGFVISLVSYKVLKICFCNDINSFQSFCNYMICTIFKSKDEKFINEVSNVINGVMNIILLVTFYIMISGFSSFLHQEFYIGRFVGSIVIVFLCYVAFKKNIDGVIKISNFLVPVLIVFLLFISAKNMNFIDNYCCMEGCFLHAGWCMPIVKAILYGSYNCILLIPVVVTLSGLVKDNGIISKVGIATFFTIIILSLSVYNILLLGDSNTFMLEMPIIQIVRKYGSVYRFVYLIMIAISIYTTAISTGCGFLNGGRKKRYNRNLFIMCVSAIFLSQISFSMLVNLLYPVLGVIGFFEVLAIIKS